MDEQINEQINGSIDRKKWMKQHFGELDVSIEKTIKIRTKRAGLHYEYWKWIWSWTICNNIREAKKSNADIESPWNYPWILIIKYGLDPTTTLIQKHTARQGKARQHFHYQQDPDVSQIQVDGLQTQISWMESTCPKLWTLSSWRTSRETRRWPGSTLAALRGSSASTQVRTRWGVSTVL